MITEPASPLTPGVKESLNLGSSYWAPGGELLGEAGTPAAMLAQNPPRSERLRAEGSSWSSAPERNYTRVVFARFLCENLDGEEAGENLPPDSEEAWLSGPGRLQEALLLLQQLHDDRDYYRNHRLFRRHGWFLTPLLGQRGGGAYVVVNPVKRYREWQLDRALSGLTESDDFDVNNEAEHDEASTELRDFVLNIAELGLTGAVAIRQEQLDRQRAQALERREQLRELRGWVTLCLSVAGTMIALAAHI